MLIVTWNVNSLRARLPRVLELLDTHAPDVVLLQETKCGPDTFPSGPLADAGYTSVAASGGQWAGVAILARAPLVPSDPAYELPGDVAPHEARWVTAVVGGIRFVSTYVPNGRALDSPEYPRKLAFLRAAAAWSSAAAADSAPLVIGGDLNIAPADIDVYDPSLFAGSTHVSAEERGLLAAWIADADLVDAYRALHPDTAQFTWWDYRAGHFHKGLGMRIDLLLLTHTLTPRIASCGIDRDFRKGVKPSDHAPLLLTLR